MIHIKIQKSMKFSISMAITIDLKSIWEGFYEYSWAVVHWGSVIKLYE